MVHDLEELTPTAGATVRLFSEKRQLLCEGTTGADGLARISYSTDDRGAAVLLIVEDPGRTTPFCGSRHVRCRGPARGRIYRPMVFRRTRPFSLPIAT
ncbi:MAG: hypothetical protein ACOX52_15235 [Verrucomicrobiota bacterium]